MEGWEEMPGLDKKKRSRPKLFLLWEISTTSHCSFNTQKSATDSLPLKSSFKHHRLKRKVMVMIIICNNKIIRAIIKCLCKILYWSPHTSFWVLMCISPLWQLNAFIIPTTRSNFTFWTIITDLLNWFPLIFCSFLLSFHKFSCLTFCTFLTETPFNHVLGFFYFQLKFTLTRNSHC